MDSSSDDAKNDDMTVGQCEAGETNSNFECSIKLEESHNSASTHDLVDKHLHGGSYEVYTEGDYDEDYYSDQLSERTDRFQITEVRMAFIRKVYTLLFLQLALTTAYVALFIFIDDLRRFALRNYEIFQVCLLIQFILVIVLTCCPQTRRRSPLNLILFFLFTATFGYCLGVVSVQYETISVILTFGICTACCLAVTIFAFTTTIDFTKFGIYLFIAFICFTVSLFILLFVWAPLAHKIFSGIAALLFMVYLIYDTQWLMGGKSYEISPDDYVTAALNLYLDMIYIFIFVLGLVGNRR